MTIHSGMFVTPSIRLSHPLGEGGMGEVWVADHLNLERKVAVKLIRDLESDSARARFELEAKAAARIQNPHVVQIFDYGIASNGLPFITMELLSGESLAERIARGPLPPQELASILAQTASALTTAHESGVVHRDIKPPNIFLVQTPSGEPFVKLLDFGIAKVHSDSSGVAGTGSGGQSAPLTRAGTLIGTPDYMSPEQLVTTDEITFHTDIWSLGVVAYEALYGERPFTGGTIVALCFSISEARFERHRISAHLLPWFDRALAVAPANRFPSVMAAAESFRLLAMSPPSAPLPPQVASAGPSEPKGLSSRLTWGLAAIGCVLGAVFAMLIVQSGATSSTPSKSTANDESETEPSIKSKKAPRKARSDATDGAKSAAPDERLPTATSTAGPRSHKSQPASAPPVPSRCKDSCRDVGACGESGSTCVVRSSADCRQSNMCSRFGKCSKTGSRCGATSAADCAAATVCKTKASCGLKGSGCAPTASAHCKQSPLASPRLAARFHDHAIDRAADVGCERLRKAARVSTASASRRSRSMG